jgi:hypothetical protein
MSHISMWSCESTHFCLVDSTWTQKFLLIDFKLRGEKKSKSSATYIASIQVGWEIRCWVSKTLPNFQLIMSASPPFWHLGM